MQKESQSFEVFPLGATFWKMHQNRPKEFIISAFEIRVRPGLDPEFHYTIHFHAGGGNLGTFEGYTTFQPNSDTPNPYPTREKLVASLF